MGSQGTVLCDKSLEKIHIYRSLMDAAESMHNYVRHYSLYIKIIVVVVHICISLTLN